MSSPPLTSRVGDMVPGRVLGPITRMDIARYSVATGDPNRVHLEEAVALAVGLPGVIGSGGIVTGLVEDVITSWAGIGCIVEARTRITSPLFPGSTVEVNAQVKGRSDQATSVILEVQAQVVNGDGTTLLEGSYTVAVPR